MPSFRARVLEALDIHKKTVKLQVNERFPKTFKTDAASTTTASYFGEPSDETGAYTVDDHVDYAVSKCIRQTTIGPSFTVGSGETAQLQKLDVLGFIVGDRPSLSLPADQLAAVGSDPGFSGLASTSGYPSIYKNSYPDSLAREGTLVAHDYDFSTQQQALDVNKFNGFHYLNGLYDGKCKELDSMRKSSIAVEDLDTISNDNVGEHAHKDWPDNVVDQVHLLNENPYADALYYHSMRLSMLITGITIPNSSEKASNHRGVVRMLILRPRMPTVKTRWTGDTNQPVINMAYPPHWDTDLFYSGKKTLAGRLDNTIHRDKVNATSGGVTIRHEDLTHISPTFGFENRRTAVPTMDLDPNSIHYAHEKPEQGTPHDLTAFDLFSAPINRDAYTVIADKTFTLDTRHHGVASTRMENVVIPFNKKVKFPGRKPDASFNGQENCPLTNDTFDDPLNMPSRPIIMFMSLDQKISCQLTGYTAITEC